MDGGNHYDFQWYWIRVLVTVDIGYGHSGLMEVVVVDGIKWWWMVGSGGLWLFGGETQVVLGLAWEMS